MAAPAELSLPPMPGAEYSPETAAQNITDLIERHGPYRTLEVNEYIRATARVLVERGMDMPADSAAQFGTHVGLIVGSIKSKLPDINAGTIVESFIWGYEEVAGEQKPDWRMWAVFKALKHDPDLELTMARMRGFYDRRKLAEIIIGSHRLPLIRSS